MIEKTAFITFANNYTTVVLTDSRIEINILLDLSKSFLSWIITLFVFPSSFNT